MSSITARSTPQPIIMPFNRRRDNKNTVTLAHQNLGAEDEIRVLKTELLEPQSNSHIFLFPGPKITEEGSTCCQESAFESTAVL